MNLHRRVKIEIKNIENLEIFLFEMKSIFYVFINLYILYIYIFIIYIIYLYIIII